MEMLNLDSKALSVFPLTAQYGSETYCASGSSAKVKLYIAM